MFLNANSTEKKVNSYCYSILLIIMVGGRQFKLNKSLPKSKTNKKQQQQRHFQQSNLSSYQWYGVILKSLQFLMHSFLNQICTELFALMYSLYFVISLNMCLWHSIYDSAVSKLKIYFSSHQVQPQNAALDGC